MNGEQSSARALNERQLWFALIPTAGFMVAEVIGGIATGSLALVADAAHMATDVFGLAIAIIAIRLGRRPADRRRTYGYERFEILAAAFNAVLLFAVAGYIIFEAYRRLYEPPQINSTGMFIIAALGLGVNLFSMRMLSASKNESLNVKGAYLEVLSDLLGSIGVILAAVIIRYTGWPWVDSAVAILIGLWVIPRTWTLLKESGNVLLEGAPDGLDLEIVYGELLRLPGVTDVHDLHVWSLTSGRVAMTAHLVVPYPVKSSDVLIGSARTMLDDRFGIDHVTLQVEGVPCSDAATHKFL